MTSAANSWGPFAPNLDEAERRARLRCLRGLSRVLAGPRAADLCRQLAAAEHDAGALSLALAALDRLLRANADDPGNAVSDREIARRAGLSPQTIGNIRRALP